MARPNVYAHCMMPAWRPLAGNAVFVKVAMIPGTAIAPHADNLGGSGGNSQKKSLLCFVTSVFAVQRVVIMETLNIFRGNFTIDDNILLFAGICANKTYDRWTRDVFCNQVFTSQ